MLGIQAARRATDTQHLQHRQPLSRQFQIVSTLALVMASTVAFIAVSRPLAAQPIPNIYNIGNRFADKCLQPVDGSTTAGAAIVLKPCDNTAAQQWKSVAVKFPYVHYVNQLSGMCLDARGGATNRTPVQQWPCDPAPVQGTPQRIPVRRSGTRPKTHRS